jgi:hypothetical protein
VADTQKREIAGASSVWTSDNMSLTALVVSILSLAVASLSLYYAYLAEPTLRVDPPPKLVMKDPGDGGLRIVMEWTFSVDGPATRSVNIRELEASLRYRGKSGYSFDYRAEFLAPEPGEESGALNNLSLHGGEPSKKRTVSLEPIVGKPTSALVAGTHLLEVRFGVVPELSMLFPVPDQCFDLMKEQIENLRAKGSVEVEIHECKSFQMEASEKAGPMVIEK